MGARSISPRVWHVGANHHLGYCHSPLSSFKGGTKMKIVFSALVGSAIAVAGSLTATAQTMDHTMITAQEIKWVKGPSSIPPGAESAVLYGDPGKEGMFAFRLKLPKGYQIPPHTHPKPEI